MGNARYWPNDNPIGKTFFAGRSEIARIDARMHLQTQPLSASIEEMRQAFRVGPILAGLLGAFALGLATVGMFGVFAYAVRQRTREIGIRMALGAQPADVVRLILSGHSRAVLGGLGSDSPVRSLSHKSCVAFLTA